MEKEKESVRIFLPLIIIAAVVGYLAGSSSPRVQRGADESRKQSTKKEIVLPVKWGNLGKQMSEAGAIDAEKFQELYAGRGGLDEETKKLLSGGDNGNLKVTEENSGAVLNMLWALGLGNKNEILEKGPMSDPRYGGGGGFASTGGWTLAKGDAMGHFSKHRFIALNADQQKLVERVSKNIYRPCCDNSTYFPDCNHGMAMLGLLELMASQGISENDMYKFALQVNALWFPGEYEVIEKYLISQGTTLAKADPKEILSAKYSSGSGYRKILQKVGPAQQNTGGGCGVDAGAPQAAPKQQTGCGV